MKLSREQEAACQAIEGAHMVIAVPGAGKTTILLERIENLIAAGVDPKKILNISFSKAAAVEMEDRFNRKKIRSGNTPDFQTIHAFSYRILRDYGRKNNIDYKLLEGRQDINKYQLIAEIYKKYNRDFLSEEKLETLVNKIGYVKNMMMEPAEIRFNFAIENFKDIYISYEEYKEKYNYIDFDDMISLALDALKKDSSIRQKYIDYYEYIQVDEGQDTSKIQMEIIKILTRDKQNLFIVADDDQSIYSFRGADPKGLFGLQATYPDLKIHYLEKNYRSTENIVRAANTFIEKNTERFEKTLVSSRTLEKPVEILKVQDIFGQYDYILEDIEENNYEYSDIGILFRNNVSQMGLIDFLDRKEIPFNVRDTSKIKFYNNRVAQDILDIISFAKNQEDIESFEKIFYKIRGYISRVQVEYLKTAKSRGTVFDTLEDMPDLKDFYFREFRELRSLLSRLNHLPMERKLKFIGEELAYIDYLQNSSKSMNLGINNQKMTFDYIKEISQNVKNEYFLEGRLKYLDELARHRTRKDQGINLYTIHSAKGLEYKVVYMVDIFEGAFPSSGLKELTAEELEEERRLFYVGMTRAKDRLNILFPKKIINKESQESIFIRELMENR